MSKLCTPINLIIDMALWYNPLVYDSLTESYRNLSSLSDPYDCGLTSVPCESNITKSLAFSNSEFVFWFDLFTINILLTVLTVLGIVGNVINIVVLATNNIANDSTNTLFLWLSVSDLMCSLSCGCVVLVCFFCFFDESLALSAFNASFPYVLDTMKRTSLLSLDFVTLISVQRAVAVVLPFKTSAIFTNKNVRIMITFIIAVFVITQIPNRVGYYPRWTYHPYFDKVVSLGYSFRIPFQPLQDYVGIYYFSRSAVDMIILTVAVSITIVKLNLHSKERVKLTGNTAALNNKSSQVTKSAVSSTTKMSVQEVRVIKMSIAVSIITFVIYSFNMMNTALMQVYAANVYGTPIVPATTNGGIVLSAFGASFNFFLYLAMSSLYRVRFFEMFRIQYHNSKP